MKDLDEFLATYAPEGHREVIDIDMAPFDMEGGAPFVVVRFGRFTLVLAPQALKDHLCVDAHPFVDGKDATVGAFGMTEGRRMRFEPTGTTSHKWASAKMIALMVGEQGVDET